MRFRRIARFGAVIRSDTGMSTAEYAIGTIAAAALAAVLYTVVTGSSVVSALTGLIERALSVTLWWALTAVPSPSRPRSRSARCSSSSPLRWPGSRRSSAICAVRMRRAKP